MQVKGIELRTRSLVNTLFTGEDRAVFAGEERVDERAGAELDPLDLLEDLGSDRAPVRLDRRFGCVPTLLPVVRHGTPTASRILATMRSESISSASASKVSSTRCRSTSHAIAFTSSGTT